MSEENSIDFIAAVGQEYCHVVNALGPYDAFPQDGYEVFSGAFEAKPFSSSDLLRAKESESELERIRDIARKWHETTEISADHIREVIERILKRWP